MDPKKPRVSLADLQVAREKLKTDIETARKRFGEGRELSIAKAALVTLDQVIESASNL
ncbi:MAG: hypothetical protein KGS72_27395 [Cyanobacteria bacterium REEB67]|nr:hypothetical protein [Cyanobacteria bacterium REEB67]